MSLRTLEHMAVVEEAAGLVAAHGDGGDALAGAEASA